MPIVKYRKKPVVVEAITWNGKNAVEIQAWTNGLFRTVMLINVPKKGDITAEVWDRLHSTWMGVKTGDLIIKGLSGEFYPHDSETTEKAYTKEES